MEGFPEYNFPDRRISRVQFFLMEGLLEYNFPDRRISSVQFSPESIQNGYQSSGWLKNDMKIYKKKKKIWYK
jgi:hypothetical protein